jgi:hypothetical protein
MNLTTLKSLARRGQELYASKYMRKQWVRKTVSMLERGKHLLSLENSPKRIH